MSYLKNSILSILVLLPSFSSFANEELSYPELMVSPSASERVLIEAKKEQATKYRTHIPVQISALTTLVAGFTQMSNVDKSKDTDELSPYVGIAIGAGWLGLTMAMSKYYLPYLDSYNETKGLPDKTPRQRLVKERLSEEAIDRAASVGKKVMWLSTLSNVFANGYMLSNAKSKTFSIPLNAVGVLTSFAPMIFEYTWQKVSHEQSDYKKKIYSPISLSSVLYEPSQRKLAPGLLVTVTF